MEKEKKKNSKKEIKVLFIILLLVMAICGSVGYGVYSYFWAKGEFSMDAGTTVIGTFGAYIRTSGDDDTFDSMYYHFIAGDNTGYLQLQCSEDGLTLEGPNTCYAIARFYNDGDTNVRMNLSSFEADVENTDQYAQWTPSEVRASSTEFTLAPKAYQNIRVEVDLTNTSESASSSSGVEVSESTYTNDEITLSVNFDISATQELD